VLQEGFAFKLILYGNVAVKSGAVRARSSERDGEIWRFK